MNSTTTGNSRSQRNIVNSDQSFLMNEKLLKVGEDIISRRGRNLLETTYTNSIKHSDTKSRTRTDSTGLDSGNGSSDQQSHMISLGNLASDSKLLLASDRCEIDVTRVSDHSELGVPDISIDVQDFCKTHVLNEPRGNADSIASETLLYDILYSPGK